MIKVAILVLFLSLCGRGDAGRADTWFDCNCRWAEWKPWSDCTSDCFGIKERTRGVWITQYPGCDEFEDCATRDMGKDDQDCNQICHNGGTLLGDECRCQAGYTGTCCRNRITCGTPDDIDSGQRTCTSSYYAGTCTYTCNSNYNLTGGSTIRSCQLDATWSGQKPYCAHVNHCASQPCQNGGQCMDLLDDYNCTCQTGWSGKHCEIDVQPPVMSGCSESFYVNATDSTQYAQWEEPVFSDPMGTVLDIVANYPGNNFTFPWDDFTVQYVAIKKSNGLKTECQFDIKVRPTPCKELNAPANGALVCNGWKRDFGLYCLVACQSGSTIDPSQYTYETMYVCGASGNWIASGPVPDCNIQMEDPYDIVMLQPSYSAYSFESSCTDPTAIAALQTLYIDTITGYGSFNEVCYDYPDECRPENVQIECSNPYK